MAKESAAAATEKAPPSSPQSPTQQHTRHKSSGTINMLIETRRQASDQYMRAQRAEKAYRARKNATLARTTLRETKTHFRQALTHLSAGFRGLWAVTKATPYLLAEKRDVWRRKKDARNRAKVEEQRRRIEERLAREYVDADAGAGADAEGEDKEGSSTGSSEKAPKK